MSSKYVLYRSRQDFEAKHAIGIFTQQGLTDYFRQNEVTDQYLVLEDSFFGKLQPVGKVEFLWAVCAERQGKEKAPSPELPEIVPQSANPPISRHASIVKLSDDARRDVTTRVKELSALIAKSSALSRDAAATDDLNLRNEFGRLQREFPISAMQQDFDSLIGLLGHHDAWVESETCPIYWNLHGNEELFFHRPVCGKVFIYRNGFYAIDGAISVEEMRSELVAFCGG